MIQCQHVLNQFLVVFRSDIPEEVSWHQTKGVPSFFSSPFSRLLNISSLKSLLIWGPTKTTSLIFASLSRGNFSATYLKAGPVRSMAFTKFFIRPSLMFRGGNRILCHSASAVLHIYLSDLPSFSVRPVSLQAMQSLCSAVLFTWKTATFRVSQLETHQQRH